MENTLYIRYINVNGKRFIGFNIFFVLNTSMCIGYIMSYLAVFHGISVYSDQMEIGWRDNL